MTATYRATIQRLNPEVNAAGVEASMRLQYGTLDHLDDATFRQEIDLARQCETHEPGFLKRCADSYGMGADYNNDERHLQAARS